MVWQSSQADDETVARRRALARAVREDLVAAGLPVTTGDRFFTAALATGADVTVDTLDDENGGGVYVDWRTHYVLGAAARTAVFKGQSTDPVAEYSGAVHDAMQDAIEAILTAAGHTVVRDHNKDYEPYQLKIVGPAPREQSWRPWLDDQQDAETKLMHETYRRQRAGE